MFMRTNRGFGETAPGFPGAQVIPFSGTGVNTIGVQVNSDPVPAGTYQAALDQLPPNATPPNTLTDQITAALQANPLQGPGSTTTSWLPWVAGGLFLILFLPLVTHGGRH